MNPLTCSSILPLPHKQKNREPFYPFMAKNSGEPVSVQARTAAGRKIRRLSPLFLWGLCILLLLSLCAGCNAEPAEEEIGHLHEEDIFDPSQVEIYTSAWPEELLPSFVPEYTAGELVGYSGIQSALSLTITGTDEEDIKLYRRRLKDKNFAVSKEGLATREGVEVSVDFLVGSKSAVISVCYTDAQLWPEEMMIDVPLLEYGVITYIDFSDPDSIFMRIDHLSKPHAQLWFDLLLQDGFQKTAAGYTREDAKIELTDYNYGSWDIQITLFR